ncbi:hypothetical protein J7T55_001248 [Diaporthe amygdali]|uniref:uncharacterized protein n=1 Tax=Phomopsis amygdali TaxID=1214568 RepID=UPI0022FF2557|nr:uncharacterized protein J7T55_001248 [Diaporthe amygdali]KAJ0103878.1 hypothetical protein J7T55_001248 [Diaporthe amygdali]
MEPPGGEQTNPIVGQFHASMMAARLSELTGSFLAFRLIAARETFLFGWLVLGGDPGNKTKRASASPAGATPLTQGFTSSSSLFSFCSTENEKKHKHISV